jgi:OOP family OmpA-OmpF porin
MRYQRFFLFWRKSIIVKKAISFFSLLICVYYSVAQPSGDSIILKAQKDNIITASTIMKIENMGANINTNLPELRPTVSADGNLLFFIVENDPMNTKYNSIRNSQDIWYSRRDSFGVWGPATHMTYPLNTYFYNAVFWISPDNNRILVRNAFIEGDYVGNGVSMSYKLKTGRWSKPNALMIRNFQKYDRGTQYGATMAHDGRTLLLYMSEQKGSDNNDIYVSFLLPDSTWSEPKSVGKKINLPNNNEMTPYLASDGETLYFSSDRPGGLGDNDIWMTRRLDKSWTKWSDPVNLGAPINTPDWDAFFTLDAGGEYAYMTTSEEGFGESDIVRVKLLR